MTTKYLKSGGAGGTGAEKSFPILTVVSEIIAFLAIVAVTIIGNTININFSLVYNVI